MPSPVMFLIYPMILSLNLQYWLKWFGGAPLQVDISATLCLNDNSLLVEHIDGMLQFSVL